MCKINLHSDGLLARGGQSRNFAIISIGTRANLGRFISVIITSKAVARFAVLLATIGYSASISIVSIDSTENAAIVCYNILHDYMAGTAIIATVSTAPNNFAIVVGIEVFDGDRTKTVELYNFVGSFERATSDYVRCSACLLQSSAQVLVWSTS
jgi:hypothetical protein